MNVEDERDGLVEDVVEEIIIHAGDDSDESDEEIEPDEDDLLYLRTRAGEKPSCSRQF